jgi:endonuclease III related protein
MGRVARAGGLSGRRLLGVYRRLRQRFGAAGWWPAETPFEVCLGAILVQNTSWGNVERALERVRAAGRLSYQGLSGLTEARIGALVRPSGTYRVKARRIRAFLDFLGVAYGGRVEAMRGEDPAELRRRLLAVHGIGRETADSIVLYAAGLPLFVVDAYTRRVFSRLGLLAPGLAYDEVQRFFMDRLPGDAALFNDYHAQIVTLAKEICRPRPRCGECPLEVLCPKRGI